MHQRRLGADVDEPLDARGAAGRDDGLGAVHVDAPELLPGPEVAEPGGRVERDVGAARAALERGRVEQVAAHGLRPGLAHLRLRLGRARERADRPAVGGEAADQGGADEAGAAGDERGGHAGPRYCGAMSAIPEPAQRLAPAARWAWRLSWAGGCIVALVVARHGRRRAARVVADDRDGGARRRAAGRHAAGARAALAALALGGARARDRPPARDPRRAPHADPDGARAARRDRARRDRPGARALHGRDPHRGRAATRSRCCPTTTRA